MRLVVLEAIIRKAEDVDSQWRKSLASHIASEVLSRIKFK